MKVTTVGVNITRKFNLGNYESEEIGVSAYARLGVHPSLPSDEDEPAPLVIGEFDDIPDGVTEEVHTAITQLRQVCRYHVLAEASRVDQRVSKSVTKIFAGLPESVQQIILEREQDADQG